jgi:hypothetical protein
LPLVDDAGEHRLAAQALRRDRRPGIATRRCLPCAETCRELAPADKVEPWYDKYGPKRKPAWFFKALREYQRRLGA